MNKRDIVIGAVVLLAIAGIYYWRQANKEEEMVVPETLSVEEQIEDKFKFQIPEDVDKAEMKDTTGGTASGIATKDYENNKFSSTFLADLPDPEEGMFYQGWLIKGSEGDEDYSMVTVGKLFVAKGGWMVDFSSVSDYSDYDKVMITKEKTFDKTPEEKVLEGSF